MAVSGPASPAMELSLGPLLYHWPAVAARDFYFRIADEAPVDVVYLGEITCAKRTPFFAPHEEDVRTRLERAGKQVIRSTLALVMDARDMAGSRAAAAGDGLVEANDIACAAQLEGTPHAIGPFVNVYNEDTLAFLAGRGAVRVTLPAELSARALAGLARAAHAVVVEVQAFGRLPLAISARCYHARAHDLHKDGCQFVCADEADGLDVETIEGAAIFAVNGTQTLSHGVCNLIGELAALRAMGVGCLRLWPQSCDMVAVAQTFRDVLDGREDAGAAGARLSALVPWAQFTNGYFHGREGAAWVSSPE